MIANITKFRFSNFVEKMIQMTKQSINKPPTSSQNALAQKVLQKINKGEYKAQYQAKLKSKVSIESQMQELERELKEQIVKALKVTQQKLKYKLKVANEALEHLSAMKQTGKKWSQEDLELVEDYHKLVKQCETARYELIVHRHAVGFTIKNHELVNGLYPMPPRFQV